MGPQMNPYQKIIIGENVIQAGEMDTPVKFAQLTEGVELSGQRVLDCGCNLGMMCYLAAQQGSYVVGVDVNRSYIAQARSLFPDLDFRCVEAEGIYGNYDIIIASALLHYVRDLDRALEVFARCTKKVLCDVWLSDSPGTDFTLSHRNLFIPSRSAFMHIVGRHFAVIEERGSALSPDSSRRYIFHLSEPTPRRARAVLIYGPGGSGKTTLAEEHVGYSCLRTDNLFATWKVARMPLMFSAGYFSNLVRGMYLDDYLEFFISTLSGWLRSCVNRDVVIEGYELTHPDFRTHVRNLLGSNWEITEIDAVSKRTEGQLP